MKAIKAVLIIMLDYMNTAIEKTSSRNRFKRWRIVFPLFQFMSTYNENVIDFWDEVFMTCHHHLYGVDKDFLFEIFNMWPWFLQTLFYVSALRLKIMPLLLTLNITSLQSCILVDKYLYNKASQIILCSIITVSINI